MLKSHYLKTIFLLLSSLGSLHSDANDNAPARLLEAFTVSIDSTIISATDIQTQKLHSSQLDSEVKTFATRINLASLIDTRKDYLTALAKQTTTHITLKQSQQNVRHLQNLQRENAVSTRKLLAQKNQLELDKANFDIARQQSDNIRLQAQSKWGKVLSHWFLTEPPPYTNMLSTLNKAVYLIYLPVPLISPMTKVSIHPYGLREQAQPASLISSAPIYSIQQQTGAPFFYLSDQAIDTYHQRVAVWLPLKTGKTSGFIIPASAIVWHLGQAYIYLQVDDEVFKRVKISRKKLLSSDSYFIQDSLQEGDILVSMGAQMLLSEEFRGQIPADDDDDDDD
ncbi:MAG: hypothetical protein GQ583_10395 [Methyloprofundus sp.]|nr:hypothetical protein [Methyloprofundus sp.]